MIDRTKFSRIDELLDAALDKPPEERLRFIEEAAAGDDSIRAEVEKLLELSAEEDSLFPSGAMKGPIWEEVARELGGGGGATLDPGDRIGPYEIVGLLGRGGMGSVFRANDPGLQREVAVKALSRDFATSDSTLKRFEREAKLLASLNHPNIAAIYDLVEVGDKSYLVLELVEGETLAERLERGPLALSELLAIAVQMAEALGEAHRKGVVHRDLKPSNVKLTPEGRVKILDFGLAKSNDTGEGERLPEAAGHAPTTQTGVVLGTPGYMSPEQARGTLVDKRTDIWAFGCLLYEMLTGARAFSGQTPSDAIAAVLRDRVDWGRIPPKTPTELRRLIERCLDQDPRHRLQDIGDARIELTDLARRRGRRALFERGDRSMGRWLALASFAAFFAGMVFFRAIGDRRPFVSRGPVTRTTIVLGPEERLWLGASSSLALSPDGSRLAFVGEVDGRVQLFLRELDSYALTAIRGSEDARDPFFSPDGEWIGFFAQGEMRKVAVGRGLAETITAASLQSRGAHWGENGAIVFAQDGAAGLFSVSAEGGEPVLLSEPEEDAGTLEHLWPQWLPGGKHILFTRRLPSDTGFRDELCVLEWETGETTVLGPGAQGVYVPSGHIIYIRRDVLEAVAFEPGTLRVGGSGAVSLVERVNVYPVGASTFAVSQSGTLVYVNRTPSAVLDIVDRGGEATSLQVAPGTPGWPRIAPGGRLAAIHIGGRESREVWILDLDRQGAGRQLTFQGGGFPTWSADGTQIAFMSRRAGGGDIYVTAADGSSAPERLLGSGRTAIPVSWSSRGVLAYYEIGDVTQRDIWVVDVTGGGEAVPFVGTPANELSPVFSPDGRYLAYVSNETGRKEVYVRPYPPPGTVTTVSVDGGAEPVWSADGRQLFYKQGSALMAAPVSTESGFRVGQPQEVLDVPLLPGAGGNPSYDVFPDGAHFLTLRAPPGASVDRLQVVLNWTEELMQLVPVARSD